MTEPERPAAPSLGVTVPAEGETIDPTQSLGLETHGLSQRQLAWRRFKRHRLAVVSAVILLIIGVAVLLADVLSPYEFDEIHLDHGHRWAGPRMSHWLGTDNLGRDEFTRLLYGGRISLAVGVGVALSSGLVGTIVGAASGFYGRRLDAFLMRVTDLFLSMPILVILIVASQVPFVRNSGTIGVVIILSLFFWMPIARIVRGSFLALKEREFVEAARSLGASNRRIIFRHILPSCIGPIIVNATLSVAAAILSESVLSFLGFGIKPPTPTWGNMLNDGVSLMTIAPHLVWFPGLMILLTVLCVNLLGDGLRDALDPAQQRVRA